MENANRNSWKTLPPIGEKSQLPLSKEFTDEEFEVLTRGSIPEDMDDKWFIFNENNNLYFHRSWTGHFVYQVEINKSETGYFVANSWTDSEYVYEEEKEESLLGSARLLEFLIDSLLLRKDVEFPFDSK